MIIYFVYIGMFTSNLEVAKFEHAKIKTVSGIRGTIKKALTDRGEAEMQGNNNGHHGGGNGGYAPGTFRATFEDKLLISDIVICRLWVAVPIKPFYNPVLSLLGNSTFETMATSTLPLMRTTAQLRRDLAIAQTVNKDSVYKPIINRAVRDFGNVRVSAKLQDSLPYASKPKTIKAKNAASYVARRAVVVEPEERKARALVQTLQTIKKDKDMKRKEANTKRSKEKQKVAARETERFAEVHKDEKKRKYRETALESARMEKKKARN